MPEAMLSSVAVANGVLGHVELPLISIIRFEYPARLPMKVLPKGCFQALLKSSAAISCPELVPQYESRMRTELTLPEASRL
ncbi:MAG: hypothetical protein ACD_39C01382G0001 [uncultured bacterium]|nr:MAG: hypothetical protein ACD_39C01382G0001 [uncultured bacterium]